MSTRSLFAWPGWMTPGAFFWAGAYYVMAREGKMGWTEAVAVLSLSCLLAYVVTVVGRVFALGIKAARRGTP